ncbi:MAG: helix-turn-helix domain-containing protein [Bulleidia sp.]
MNTFGEKLKQARERKGYTQEQLGEKLFVTRQTISRYESGNRLPDIHTLKAISRLLDCSMDELLSENDLSDHCNTQPVYNDRKGISILIILYTMIICIHTILMIQSFPSFSLQELSYPVVMIQAWIHGVQAVLFVYGLVGLVRSDFNARQAGIITTGFLLTEAVQLFSTYVLSTPEAALLLSMPYLIGAVCAYRFYFKEKQKDRVIVTAVCIYAVFVQVYGMYAMLLYADHLYTSLHTVNRIGSVLIDIMLIQQIHLLYQRRELTKSLTRQHI